MSNAVKPTYFATPADFRTWLAQHHDKAQELWGGYYRTPAIWWVISAKKAETQQKRLETLINDSAHSRRIAQLRRNSEQIARE